MLRAGHPRRVSLEVRLDHPQVQRPPPATLTAALVIPSAATPTPPAPAPLPGHRTHRDDDHALVLVLVLVELHTLNDRLLDSKIARHMLFPRTPFSCTRFLVLDSSET